MLLDSARVQAAVRPLLSGTAQRGGKQVNKPAVADYIPTLLAHERSFLPAQRSVAQSLKFTRLYLLANDT